MPNQTCIDRLLCKYLPSTIQVPNFGATIIYLGLVQFTPKIFQDFPSHQILWHMHEALNIEENKN